MVSFKRRLDWRGCHWCWLHNLTEPDSAVLGPWCYPSLRQMYHSDSVDSLLSPYPFTAHLLIAALILLVCNKNTFGDCFHRAAPVQAMSSLGALCHYSSLVSPTKDPGAEASVQEENLRYIYRYTYTQAKQ